MLVFSRKKGEAIVINDDINVWVVEIRGDKVRLGIEAPKEVPVHRNEVYEAIRRHEAKPSLQTDGGASTKVRAKHTAEAKSAGETPRPVPANALTQKGSASVQRNKATSIEPSWRETLSRSWRIVQDWFNKLMAATAPVETSPSNVDDAESARPEISPAAADYAIASPTQVVADEADAGNSEIAAKAMPAAPDKASPVKAAPAKKKSPRKKASKAATVKVADNKANGKAAPKKAAVKKPTSPKRPTKTSGKSAVKAATTRKTAAAADSGNAGQASQVASQTSATKKTSVKKSSTVKKAAPRKRTPK